MHNFILKMEPEFTIVENDGTSILMVLSQLMVESILIMNDIILTKMVECAQDEFIIRINDIDAIHLRFLGILLAQWLILL
jgi:glycopeptide antibiotics resistance protein